jgi:hypothetical protein
MSCTFADVGINNLYESKHQLKWLIFEGNKDQFGLAFAHLIDFDAFNAAITHALWIGQLN